MSDLIDKERLQVELDKLHTYFGDYTPSEIVLICNNFILIKFQQIVLDVMQKNKKS